MTAVIGAGAILIVILLTVLIICGLPLGEFTMGGQYKVFGDFREGRIFSTDRSET